MLVYPPIDSISWETLLVFLCLLWQELKRCCSLFFFQHIEYLCAYFSLLFVHVWGFATVNRLNIYWNSPWSGPAPIRLPKSKSPNKKKRKMSYGGSVYLFACQVKQNVYNRQSIISFATVAVYHFLLISVECHVVGGKEGAVDGRDGSLSFPCGRSNSSFLFHKREREDDDFIPHRLWVASFTYLPRSRAIFSVVVIKK